MSLKENEIKQLLEAIEKRYEERLKKTQNLFEKNAREIKKYVKLFKKRNNELCKKN